MICNIEEKQEKFTFLSMQKCKQLNLYVTMTLGTQECIFEELGCSNQDKLFKNAVLRVYGNGMYK